MHRAYVQRRNKLSTENFSWYEDYNLIAVIMVRSWIRRILCLKWCSVDKRASDFYFRGEEMDIRTVGIGLLSVRLKPLLFNLDILSKLLVFKPGSNVTDCLSPIWWTIFKVELKQVLKKKSFLPYEQRLCWILILPLFFYSLSNLKPFPYQAESFQFVISKKYCP